MMQLMASMIRVIASSLSDNDVDTFITEILHARRIYVMGAGRSGLVAKGFAMRLMHLGLQSYVVGETITPALQKGDVMVIFSGPAGPRPLPILQRQVKTSVHTSA